MTTRRQHCLETAMKLTTETRAHEYGDIDEVAQQVAEILDQLGLTGTAVDYPLVQIVVKLVRLSHNPAHKDSWIDIAGYAALGYEIVTGPAAPPSPDESAQPTFRPNAWTYAGRTS